MQVSVSFSQLAATHFLREKFLFSLRIHVFTASAEIVPFFFWRWAHAEAGAAPLARRKPAA
jgi:hypothetical protein